MKRSSLRMVLPPINWFGLIAGVLMVSLPLLGPWWSAMAGAEAMKIAFSPFDVHLSLLGQPIHSSLVELFLLAAKITFVIAGTLMIAGSLFPKRWWSRCLVRFGAMKPFWSIIGLVVLLVLGAFIFNSVLPRVLFGRVGGVPGMEDAAIQINVPYISGATVSTIQIGATASITAPITASLTGVFWLAVVAAALGIAARIYHRRFVHPEGREARKA